MQPQLQAASNDSHLPNPADVELIVKFQYNPLLFAKSSQLRRCLLRNVLYETGVPNESSSEKINVGPLEHFDPILKAIYKAPMVTFWQRTCIALDLFECMLEDPELWIYSKAFWDITGKRPFILDIVHCYYDDLEAHFFPKPGTVNCKENDPKGRLEAMNSLAVVTALRVSIVTKHGKKFPQVFSEIFEVLDTLWDCVDYTEKKIRVKARK